MHRATRSDGAARPETGVLALWFGILGPPMIWAARIGTSYVLVPYACWWDRVPLLHAVTVAALLLTAAAGGVAWNAWRRAGGGREVELGGAPTRTRFMAILGMLSSGLFFLVMVAEGLANFLVDPCQTAGAPLA